MRANGEMQALLERNMTLPEDVHILVSMVNMYLRDRYSSPQDLCEDLDADLDEMEAKLASAGYRYDENTNSYKLA